MPSGGILSAMEYGRGPCLCAALLFAGLLNGQERFGVGPDRLSHILAGDRAVLSSEVDRTDLQCRVEPLEPRMDFELKFQAGYLIHVPMAELASDGDRLSVLFRIRPLTAQAAGEKADAALYFTQYFDVPPIEEDAKGSVTLPGRYVLGPGRYRIDWLMRDRVGRVCSAHWETQAASLERYEELAAAATAHTIAANRRDIFVDEPPVMRSGKRPAHVRLVLNLSPLEPSKPKLSEYDLASLMAMMRALHREPGIGLFSVTAILAGREEIVYDAPRLSRIDFKALGEAVEGIAAGTVDFAALRDTESGGRFLAGVLNRALSGGENHADAVIVLGPKTAPDNRIPEELLDIAGKHPPVFHFAYNRNPRSYPWRGAIGNALRPLGAVEYRIARPKDFGAALTDFVRRLEGGHAPGASTNVETGAVAPGCCRKRKESL